MSTIDLRGPTGAWLSTVLSDDTLTIEENGLSDQSVEARLPFSQPGRYELRVSANGQTRILPLTGAVESDGGARGRHNRAPMRGVHGSPPRLRPGTARVWQSALGLCLHGTRSTGATRSTERPPA